MQHPGFFERAGPFTVDDVAAKLDVEIRGDGRITLTGIAPLSDASASELSFLNNRKYVPQLASSAAAACLVRPAFVVQLPDHMVGLLSADPYRSFALALRIFYPDALTPKIADQAHDQPIHPSASLEPGVRVEPGAIIGPEAMIGRGSVIAAGAVIGYRCAVGRDCFIGPQTTVSHSLLGDRVVVHAGARLGQDGYGFAMGAEGHLKVPQIGRVIVQDDVEIGANTTIDRGALKDTIIGEGTKIDNLVQIGHNVRMGRHCIIVAQTGISGSTELGDFVVMGGQSGAVGHIRIGTGAQIAGGSHPKEDVPPGARMGGTPARPLRQWGRELAVLKRLASDKSEGQDDET